MVSVVFSRASACMGVMPGRAHKTIQRRCSGHARQLMRFRKACGPRSPSSPPSQVDEGPEKGQLPEAKRRKQGRVKRLRHHKARASPLQPPTARRVIVQERNGRACLSSWDATNALNSNSNVAQGHPPPLAVHARRCARPAHLSLRPHLASLSSFPAAT